MRELMPLIGAMLAGGMVAFYVGFLVVMFRAWVTQDDVPRAVAAGGTLAALWVGGCLWVLV